jgi:hypothetical protein
VLGSGQIDRTVSETNAHFPVPLSWANRTVLLPTRSREHDYWNVNLCGIGSTVADMSAGLSPNYRT